MKTICIPYDILRENWKKVRYEEHFIFEKECIIFDIYDKEDYHLYCEVESFEGNKHFRTTFFNVKEKRKETVIVEGDGYMMSENVKDSDEEDQLSGFAYAVSVAIWYIMTAPRSRKEKNSISHKYSRQHRLSTNQNKIYLLDDIVKYVHDNYVPHGGTHNIQCECWGVRGHYRTYKSGRKVWISAYKKGKKRNEMEPKDKTYYLSKGVEV